MLHATQTDLDRANYYINAGRMEEARAILHQVLEVDYYNADAWRLLAHAATSPDEVRQALSRVLQLQPHDRWARQMLDSMDARNLVARPFGGAFVTQRPLAAVPPTPPPVVPPEPSRPRPPAQAGSPLMWGLVLGSGFVLLLAVIAGLVLTGVFPRTTFRAETTTPVPGALAAPEATRAAPTAPPQAAYRALYYYRHEDGQLISTGDHETFTFDGLPGQFVVIEVSIISGDLQPTVTLHGPDSQAIMQSRDVIPGSRITLVASHELTAAGTHYLVVASAQGSGTYQIIVRAN